jgi:hypothetical protein
MIKLNHFRIGNYVKIRNSVRKKKITLWVLFPGLDLINGFNVKEWCLNWQI